jgi:hypothetical protein
VENRRIEIRVVADGCGQKHVHIRLRDEMARSGLSIRGRRVVAQGRMKTLSQSFPGTGTQRHQRIQRIGRASIRRESQTSGGAIPGQQALTSPSGEVENPVSDRNPDSRLGASIASAKNSKGQILNGKIGAGRIGGFDPALRFGIVGRVESEFHR